MTESADCAVAANVDFGTHGSGFAWIVVGDGDADPRARQVNYVDQWPGQLFRYPKTLSCLLLDRRRRVVAWGAEAKSRGQTRHSNREMKGYKLKQGVKLSLRRRHDGSVRGGVLVVDDHDHSREKLAALLLRQIYDAAIRDIGERGFGPGDIRWCITVPAIWDETSKQATRRAAVAAGLPSDRLMLVYEPEAAAYYARVADLNPSGVHGAPMSSLDTPGSRFVVVDCGGETVDLTAYQMMTMAR